MPCSPPTRGGGDLPAYRGPLAYEMIRKEKKHLRVPPPPPCDFPSLGRRGESDLGVHPLEKIKQIKAGMNRGKKLIPPAKKKKKHLICIYKQITLTNTGLL